jgi:hypothetical protein
MYGETMVFACAPDEKTCLLLAPLKPRTALAEVKIPYLTARLNVFCTNSTKDILD